MLKPRETPRTIRQPFMQLRESLINLAITCALVVLVALLSVLLKDCRGVPAAVPIATPQVAAPTTTAAPAPEQTPRNGPVEGAPSETFLTLPKAQLLDSPSNEADTLHIKFPNEDHIFVLYFVDALDATATHPERVADQARFFGKTSSENVVTTGREALDYVSNLLKTHTFHVLTRWERVPNTERYYAIINVEIERGKWTYLADLLMRQGYARIGGIQTPLPDANRSVESYVADLIAHAKYARQKKLGIWEKVH